MPKNDTPGPSSGALEHLERAIERLRELRQTADFPVAYHAIVDDCLGGLDLARAGFGTTSSQEMADVLLQREQEFKALVENASDMIVRFDRDHRYLYVNPAIEELSGTSAEMILGKTNSELGVPPALSDLWKRELDRVLETGQPGQFRLDRLSPDGKRYYHVRLTAEFNRAGVVKSILAIVRDMTEAERARRTLQRYASRLHLLQRVNRAIRTASSLEEIAEAVLPYSQHLLNCARTTVALFDIEGRETRLLAVSASNSTALGKGTRLPMEWNWAMEELAQGNISVIEDLSSLDSSGDQPQILRSEGIKSMVCVPLIVKDKLIGSLNLGMTDFQPLTAEQEESAREMADQLAVAIHQADLHQKIQQHAETLEQNVAKRTAALRASETRFRAIFENAAMGIALVDMKGRIFSSNPALQKMLGYSARDLKGMKIDHFIHPEDVAQGDTFFNELVAGKRSQYRMEKRYIRQDGTVFWVRPTVSMVQNAQGQDRYAIKMVDEITEEKNMREALVQAERLTVAGRLGASLAHEISNPLQAVIGSLGLAAEMLEPDSEVSMFVGIAIEELERASDIVAQLRDLNRRSRRGERKATQLNEILEKALLLNRKQCLTQQITVEWTPASDLPEALVVPTRIRQVFLNLILNAIHVMPNGGRLQVSTARTSQPGGISVTFADSGPGIDPDLLPRLFEPFRSTKAQGLGLGLYISKTIVEEHGGTIDVASSPGQGAVFTVWLPLHENMERETQGADHG